jgi:hypothetical protein
MGLPLTALLNYNLITEHLKLVERSRIVFVVKTLCVFNFSIRIKLRAPKMSDTVSCVWIYESNFLSPRNVSLEIQQFFSRQKLSSFISRLGKWGFSTKWIIKRHQGEKYIIEGTCLTPNRIFRAIISEN